VDETPGPEATSQRGTTNACRLSRERGTVPGGHTAVCYRTYYNKPPGTDLDDGDGSIRRGPAQKKPDEGGEAGTVQVER
jgi:hypothetical protein